MNALKLYGPQWQYECGRCHEMSDCYESEAERDEAASGHECIEHYEIKRERDLSDELASALRAVKADRPSAHTDDVWACVLAALDSYDVARDTA